MLNRLSQFGKNFTEEMRNGDESNSPGRSLGSHPEASKKSLKSADEGDIEINSAPDVDDDSTGKLEAQSALITPEIRAKLKKFAKYEAKYPQLLEAYRTEKSKAEQITAFEKILQENTPCSSITEGQELSEYLNSLTLKNTMLNEELRKISKSNADATDSKIKELETKVSELEDSLEAKSKIEETRSEDAGDRDLSKSGDGELVKKLNEELKTAQNQLTESRIELGTLKTNLEKSKEELESSKKENETLIAKHNDEISSIKSENEKEAAALKEKVEQLEKDVSAKDRESETVEAEIKRQLEEIKLLKKALKDTNEVKDLLSEGKLSLENKFKEVEDQNSKSSEVALELEGKLQGLGNSLKEKNDEITKFKEQIEKAESQRDIESPVASSAKEIKTPSNNASSNKKNKKKKKNSGKNGETSTQNDSVKETEQLPSSETTTADDHSDLQDKYESLVKKFELYKQKNQGTDTEELQKLAKKTEELEKESEESKKETSDVRSQLRSKNEEIEETKDMLRVVGDDLVTSRDELKKLQERFSNLEKSLKENNEQNEGEKAQLDENLKTIDSQKVELEVLRKQHAQIITDYEKEQAENRAQAEIRESEKFKLEAKVKELEKKIEDLTSKIKRLDTENDSRVKAITGELLSVKGAKDDLELKHKAFRTEKTELTIKISKLQDEIKELSKYKNSEALVKKELETVQSNLNQRDKTIGYFEKQVREYDSNKTQLVDEISKLKNANKDLGSKIAQLGEQRSKLNQDKVKLNDIIRDLRNQLDESIKENKSLTDKVEVLQDKYETLQETKSSSNDQVESIKKQCEELSINSKESRQKIEQLEEELSESRGMLQERTREASTIRRLSLENEQNLSAKIEELNSKLSHLTDENDRLQSENSISLSRQQRQLEDTISKNQELERVISDWETKEMLLNKEIKELRSSQEKLEFERRSSFTDSDELSGIINKLKDSLSVSERKVREYENLNHILKKLNEELNMKLDRITKNYKLASSQLNSFKDKSRQTTSTNPSPIASPISTRSNSIVSNLNTVQESDNKNNSGPSSPSPSSLSTAANDEKLAYVKNVLLGFLEHKEQRQQLLPVISMLLQLTKTDEKRLLVSLK